MKRRPVTVEEYNSQWPEDFSRISDEVMCALGSLVLYIEHVGSTSVPGLAAKPIIDLDVVISEDTSLEAVIECLAGFGYFHEGDLGIAGREAFGYQGKSHLRKHHLYVCRESSGELKRHITFRDYLRCHPEAAEEYAAVKREAARMYPDDIEAYIAHKSPCVTKIYHRCGLIPDE